MNLRLARFAVACGLLATVLTGCGSSGASERPRVVATAYPLYEAAARVGGKAVHAMNLLPGDPFGPISTKKADYLRHSELAVVLAEGVQPEVDKIVAERKAPTIRIVDDQKIVPYNTDPNIWLDPQRMADIAATVHDALRILVPADDGKLIKNFKRYNQDLAKVDKSYAEAIATCKRSDVLVEEPEFASLAGRFGLKQIEVGELTTPQPNISAKSEIERTGATTVFASRLPTLSESRRIRDVYGVRVAVLDPIAAQTDQARRGGSSYSVVMELNLDALREALDCRSKDH